MAKNIFRRIPSGRLESSSLIKHSGYDGKGSTTALLTNQFFEAPVGVTIALTGISSTISTGTVTASGGTNGNVTVTLTGTSSTASVGILPVNNARISTGQQVTLSQGTTTRNISKAITGVSSTTSPGTINKTRDISLFSITFGVETTVISGSLADTGSTTWNTVINDPFSYPANNLISGYSNWQGPTINAATSLTSNGSWAIAGPTGGRYGNTYTNKLVYPYQVDLSFTYDTNLPSSPIEIILDYDDVTQNQLYITINNTFTGDGLGTNYYDLTLSVQYFDSTYGWVNVINANKRFQLFYTEFYTGLLSTITVKKVSPTLYEIYYDNDHPTVSKKLLASIPVDSILSFPPGITKVNDGYFGFAVLSANGYSGSSEVNFDSVVITNGTYVDSVYISPNIIGQTSTAQSGTITATGNKNIALTGSQVTAQSGTISASTGYVVGLTGAQSNVQPGTILTNNILGILGQQVNSSIGSIVSDNRLGISGQQVNSNYGSLTNSVNLVPTGQSSVANTGNISGNNTLSITGSQSTAQSGIITATPTYSLLGQQTSATTSGFVASGDPYWDNVSALLHFDGTGSAFVDEKGHSISRNNLVATLVTSPAKFGGSSCSVYGDTLTIGGGSEFNLSGDFTVEAWVYWPNGTQGQDSELLATSSPNVQFRLNYVGGSIRQMIIYNGSDGIVSSTNEVLFSGDTWHHVAYTRSGSLLRFYVDGVQQGSAMTSTGSMDMSSGPQINHVYANNLRYIDDLRITKGIARYTGSTYTLPTEAFSNIGFLSPESTTVSISGQQINSTTGSITATGTTNNVTAGLVGIQNNFNAGNLVEGDTPTLSGQQVVLQVGNLAPSTTYGISSNLIVSSVGNISLNNNRQLLGVPISSQVGIITATAGQAVTVALNGIQTISFAGNISPSINTLSSGNASTFTQASINSSFDKQPIGIQNTFNVGSVTYSTSAILLGNQTTVAFGTITPNLSKGITNSLITFTNGSITANVGYVAQLNGIQTISFGGNLSPQLTTNLTGTLVNSSAGAVTSTAGYGSTLTGLSITASSGILTKSLVLGISGQQLAFSQALLSSNISKGITGLLANIYNGSISVNCIINPSSQVISVQDGTINKSVIININGINASFLQNNFLVQNIVANVAESLFVTESTLGHIITDITINIVVEESVIEYYGTTINTDQYITSNDVRYFIREEI